MSISMWLSGAVVRTISDRAFSVMYLESGMTCLHQSPLQTVITACTVVQAVV